MRFSPITVIFLLACPAAGVVSLCSATAARGADPATPPPQSVSIKNMAFVPAALTVTPGTKVTWTNNDDRDHSVADNAGTFSSGNLSPGQTFSYVFKSAGTFNYGCALHPRMKAVITVK